MRTAAVYLLAVAAVVLGVTYGYPDLWGGEPEAASLTRPASKATPVVAHRVQVGAFADAIEALGTVLANESVEITAGRTEHVTAIHFDDGDTVKATDLLVELNAGEERASLEEAQARQAQAETEYNRVKELAARDISSDGDVDLAHANLLATKARVATLQATIDELEIRAPFPGRLGLRQVSVGALVRAGDLITTLDQLDKVKVDFTLPETWLRAVRIGMNVEGTTAAWPSETFAGRILAIDSRLDARTRSVRVRALVENADLRLRPGMLLKISVDRGESDVLQVPEASIELVGDGHFVYAVGDDGNAHRTPVRVGRRRVGTVEILEGIDAGTLVILEGMARVRDGAAIEVVATRGEE